MGGLNTYGYVLGNPLSLIDPLGLQGFGGFTGGITRYNVEAYLRQQSLNAKIQKFQHLNGGATLTLSDIAPYSGGGGVIGINLEHTDKGWHWYTFKTPPKQCSVGFQPGASLTVNIAEGTGDWTGNFAQADGNLGPLDAGAFYSPNSTLDNGYAGVQFGLSVGTPYGAGGTVANYKLLR